MSKDLSREPIPYRLRRFKKNEPVPTDHESIVVTIGCCKGRRRHNMVFESEAGDFPHGYCTDCGRVLDAQPSA